MAAKTEAIAAAPTKTRRRFSIPSAYIFLTPYLIAMVMFSLGPALYSLLLSFATFQEGRPVFFAAGFKNWTLDNRCSDRDLVRIG